MKKFFAAIKKIVQSLPFRIVMTLFALLVFSFICFTFDRVF
jgi:hypothetical protein